MLFRSASRATPARRASAPTASSSPTSLLTSRSIQPSTDADSAAIRFCSIACARFALSGLSARRSTRRRTSPASTTVQRSNLDVLSRKVKDPATGIISTVPLTLSQLGAGVDAVRLHAALVERYAGERFIRVMPLSDPATLEAGGFFDVQACNDTNVCELFVFANDRQVLLLSRLDNLGKGASGAAVQNIQLMLGV